MLAAISVDLDSLPHYCRIHGVPESVLTPDARGLVHQRAVPRFVEVLSELGAPATFFAIGEDLAEPSAAEAIRQAAAAGVEIASHSHRHDYALSRRSKEEIADDLRQAEEVIAQVTGQRPLGFRAPGYTLSPALCQAIEARGYRYASSAFPAAPYYLAKAGVMGALALAGRPSRAILDSPRVLLAPRHPYYPDPDQPYRRGGGSVLELPMAVTPLVRFPFIGTFALTWPRAFIRAAYASLRGVGLFNFELHAIDLLDQGDGVPPELVRRQRDVAVPKGRKRARLRELIGWLKADFELVTLAEAARRLGPVTPR